MTLHLNNIHDALRTELGLGDSDFIKTPILFVEKTITTRTGAVAYVPGMVNLLVDGTLSGPRIYVSLSKSQIHADASPLSRPPERV
jgi:hypothetical protein